ncbi:MAG: agmatine deiminase family protein [Bacteroidales bacterium]|nr:agmatine deiminase family protein [Bacteroidales bacterium]
MTDRYLIRLGVSIQTIVASALFLFLPALSFSQDTFDTPTKLTHWLTPEELTRLNEIGRSFVETDPPASPVRNVAEFDHMQGVLVRYPFGVPMTLIKEMAEGEITVTTIVNSNSQKTTVINQYLANNVDTSHCNFLIAPTDSYWTRDYGPWFVSDSSNQIGIVDFPYNRPRPQDDEIPKEVAMMLGIPWFGMNLIHTGGNYMTDGYNNSASTELVWEENLALTHAQIASKVNAYLGITNYHVRPDPNGTYIDHIDCWGKFLAPDKILIRSVPSSHPQYNLIEQAAAYWTTVPCAYGYNYNVYRAYTPNNQPYTNSLILNRKVLVPIMNSSWDDSALAVYQEAMPGYEVIGILGTPSAPWEATDALHCRTKGIADLGMLFIHHYPLYGEQPCEEDYVIDAELIVCSDTTVISDSVLIHYRVNQGDWMITGMQNTAGTFYSGIIPHQSGENTVEYYLTAADHSGRHAKDPYIGEPDPFQFNTVYTNITAIPDTLKFNTPEDCNQGKVTILNNFTGADISVTSIQNEGFNPDYSWYIGTVPSTPYVLNANDTTQLRVRIDLPTVDLGTGYALDSLEVVTVVGTIRVIIAVNDSLLTGQQELFAGNPVHLGQNYPNPFTGLTTIPFALARSGEVVIEISDLLGNRLVTLLDGHLPTGNHMVSWDGKDHSGRQQPGGVYLFTLKTKDGIQSKRMVLIR